MHSAATEEALRRIEQARRIGATKLALFGLKLSALPEAIGQLSQLQTLDLSSNQLSALPETVRKLARLEKLLLQGNPGLGLPDEVQSRRGRRILLASQSPRAKSSTTTLPRGGRKDGRCGR